MMDWGQLWTAALVAVLVAGILTPFLRGWLMQQNLVDLPGERRSHSVPTPRGGGAAIVFALIFANLVSGLPWWPGLFLLLLLGILGWVEDRHELSAPSRLAVQAVVAVLALSLIGPVTSVDVFGQTMHLPWFWTLLSGIAIVWLINLHNFMDGSDGLAAMQGVWSGLAMGVLMLRADLFTHAAFALALAGGYAGFLLWNRPPARIFMGDSGSMALGGGVALLALAGATSGGVSIWVSLIITSLFVVDATATLARRVANGERWYNAHRQHAYQRLIAVGWSHGRVLVLYAAINLGLVLPMTLLAIAHPQIETVLAFILVGLLLGGWWVIEFATNTENRRHG